MDYPFLARLYNEYQSARVVAEYEMQMGEQGQEEETTILGTIRIPKIDVFLPIYSGTSEDVMQKGAGLMEQTSSLGGGNGTHACISAHRGLSGKRMFTRLDELEKGDVFYIKTKGKTCAYQVGRIQIVKPEETDALSVVENQDLVTLVTCTPYGINTHRMLVTGQRIPYREETESVVEKGRSWIHKWWWLLINALLLVLWIGFAKTGIVHAQESEEAKTRIQIQLPDIGSQYRREGVAFELHRVEIPLEPKTAEESMEMAQSLAKKFGKKKGIQQIVTDKNGFAETCVTQGWYLLRCSVSKQYGEIEPLLMYVPVIEQEHGDLEHAMKVNPKVSIPQDNTVKTVRTGDKSFVKWLCLLAISFAVFVWRKEKE